MINQLPYNPMNNHQTQAEKREEMEALLKLMEDNATIAEWNGAREASENGRKLLAYIRSLESTITTQAEAIRESMRVLEVAKKYWLLERKHRHVESVEFPSDLYEQIRDALDRLSHLLP